jgi:hypothetical protein
MRVAVCLSGLPRFFKIGHRFHKKYLFEKYQPDVFIHTWYNENENEHAEVIDLYKPKKYLIQKDRQIVLPREYSKGTSERYPAYNVFSLFKSIMESNNLKFEYENENDITYDWVFRLRFDYALNRDFDLENMDNDKFHFSQELEDRGMVADQFAFSNSRNMDIYSHVFPNLDRYYGMGELLIAEHMLSMHMKLNLLMDKVIWHDMNHPFYPVGGDSMTNSLIRKQVNLAKNVQNMME